MDRAEDRLRYAAEELAEGRSVVRAVIVKTWGSTPREVGADMLLTRDGSLQGTVGGGCGEAEVYELAQEMLGSEPKPAGALYHVDLTEDPQDGGEKVCGGRFDVLLYRMEPELHGALLASAGALLDSGGQLRWTAQLGRQRPGFWKSGKAWVPVEPELTFDQAPLAEPRWESSEQGEQQFCEPMGRAARLIIVGAGHIARPLCRLAAEVGYRVVVLDDRVEYAQRSFFPDAFEVVAGDYAAELPRLSEFPRTSVVLVTRGHKHDQDCLRLMVGRPLEYLGMIGSQRRIDSVYADLLSEGVPAEALRRVWAPIGLEIGARTPAEIAVSILAQMIKANRLARSDGGVDRTAEDRRRRTRSLPPTHG